MSADPMYVTDIILEDKTIKTIRLTAQGLFLLKDLFLSNPISDRNTQTRIEPRQELYNAGLAARHKFGWTYLTYDGLSASLAFKLDDQLKRKL